MASQGQNSTMVGNQIANPRGGAKSEQITKQGAQIDVRAQRIRFKRKFFDKVIGGPEVQYARLSTDAGGFKTYLSTSEYGRLNPVEQIFCEPAESSNPSINRTNQFQRVCYICGFKLFGKDSIKRGYPNGGLKGTEYLKDWRYPQIEHVMNMMEGTQYGAVTDKVKRGSLHREALQTGLKYPEYNPDDTPPQKLQKLIDFNIDERNKWPVQWYEYLWSHLLCNQVKGDVRFMRVQINEGIPVWENNNAQIDSTERGITKQLNKYSTILSVNNWINASNQWWNQEPDQLKRYIKVFCQRMTFQNMGSTSNPRATHEWAPSPVGDYNHFKFDSEALESTKTKMNPPHDQMWPALLVGGEGPREDRNVKKAFTWIKSKLLGKAGDKSKYKIPNGTTNRAISAFLGEGKPANVPRDDKWASIAEIPVEIRREAFLLLPGQVELRILHSKHDSLFTKIFGNAEGATPTATDSIFQEKPDEQPETQPAINSTNLRLRAISEEGSPPSSPGVPAEPQGTPQASQQASLNMFWGAPASLQASLGPGGEQSQMQQWGSPAILGINGRPSPTPNSAGMLRKSQGRSGLRGGALAGRLVRSELTTVREDELVGEEDLTDTINMIEEGLQEEEEEEEERNINEDIKMATILENNDEGGAKRQREDENDKTESDLEDPKRTHKKPFIRQDISELSGGDGLSDLYNKVRRDFYGVADAESQNNGTFNRFKEQNMKPGDGKDYSQDGIFTRFTRFLNKDIN
tara:strand:+ start:6243 stop:8480 length:2238 start_codon:yes stop_codon:yes gene_type:complete